MTTVGHWINHWAKAKPNKVAMVCNDAQVTYLQLANFVEAARTFMEPRVTPSPGETAVICAPWQSDAWTMMLAARALGYDTIFLSKVDGVVIRALPRVGLLLVGEQDSAAISALKSSEHADRMLIVPDSTFSPANLKSITRLRPPAGAAASGHMLLSSASTGKAKRIFVPGAQEKLVAEVFAKRRGVKATTRVHLMSYAPSSSAGYKFVLAAFQTGATVIFDESVHFARNFHTYDFNLAVMRPAQIDKLIALASAHPPKLRPQLRIHFAGGFVSHQKIEWLIRNITSNVFNDYGASECCGGFALTKVQTLDDQLWHTVYPGCRLEIVDDDGQCVPDDAEGAVRIALEAADATSYMDDPDATAIAFRDGYFYPGDMATRRADGRVRLLGRVSDVLVIKSDKFAVGPIEEDIEKRLGCSKACVFSRQNARSVEEVFVAIESDASVSEDNVKWLRQMFSAAPLVRVSSLSAFPKNEAGKVDRRALRDTLFAAAN